MEPTSTPEEQASVRHRYEKPEGAIPAERIKRFGIGAGVLVLVFLTLWGSCHRQSPAGSEKVSAAPLTALENIDSQQDELAHEIEEARRSALEAQRAKQHALSGAESGPPQQSQADPVEQLRRQLALDDLRRAHTAPFASTVAFAHQAHAAPAEGDAASKEAAALERPEPKAEPARTEAAGLAVSDQKGYRLDEGTILETVLLNRLDGEFVGPVITQIATDVYSRSGLRLLIPRGSRLLGEARNVQSFDQRRMAIVFHKAILPNGKEIPLDKMPGLDQIGQTGVVSKIDHHYLEIFGTSLALGAIGGLSQIGAYGGAGYDASTGFRIGFTERTGASAEQVLSKFLNKFPTIKVLEGSRIKVILTSDLNLEAYE